MKKISNYKRYGAGSFAIFALLWQSACATLPRNPQCSAKAPDKCLRQGVGWYRKAAEQRRFIVKLIARENFIESYINKHHPAAQEWGVVLDIDETVLDNTWYFEQCDALIGKEADFSYYIALENRSTSLPGAKAFTNWVHEQGGFVTLVSNRDGSFSNAKGNVMDVTTENLKREGIYFDQIILGNYTQSPDPKNKNPRFKAVESGICDKSQMICSTMLPAHKVIAFFGDNIQDFPELMQMSLKDVKGDAAIFDNFSQGFFVMPNPIYGSWTKLFKNLE